eukprot:CAMPEP_0118682236 /NCGR_PEP_ID=MMETSP0800-20121206/5379_1 /TAXON_ID=210618 ORGANISM="Striatella unipunctata, Strain CCMP2910" /NCGR_SAMPLE_ID=MMETSP0800 /ASSEMBLY_ACC=CAM_ASM_000638 /LENGTH=674 /DNA_ID=CAMNT_0006578615 /DNA_START=234 /DNA_END=2256 /DNA_ORIENTATION=-
MFQLAAYSTAADSRNLSHIYSFSYSRIKYCQKQVLDFDKFKEGSIVHKQYEGVTIHGISNGRFFHKKNSAMIFDAAHPTRRDKDLKFKKQGKVLILSKNGLHWHPNDSRKGGTLSFEFQECVRLDSLKLLDNEESVAITMQNNNNEIIKTISVTGARNGSKREIDLGNTPGVHKLDITMNGSGAVDDITFATLCPAIDKPTPIHPTTPYPTQTPSSKPTNKPTQQPTDRPTPTSIPPAHPSPPPELLCGDDFTENTKHLGMIPAFYENLPPYNGYSIDLTSIDASSVYSVKGQTNMVIEFWAKCQTNTGNENNLLLFSRRSGEGLGLIENYQFEQHQRVICGGTGAMGAVQVQAAASFEYLVVTLHDGVGDMISAGVSCKTLTRKPTNPPIAKPTKSPTPQPTEEPIVAPTKSPTKEPTGAPTQKPIQAPTPAPEFDCGDGTTINTRDLSQIDSVYEGLPSCQAPDGSTLYINLDSVNASYVFTVQGQTNMFIELWAKCRTDDGNTNTLLVSAATNLSKAMESSMDTVLFEIDAKGLRQYLFVSLHYGVGDMISGGVSCSKSTQAPTSKPTLKPTLRPTKRPTLRPTLTPTKRPTQRPTRRPSTILEIGCDDGRTRNTQNLGQIDTRCEYLPSCSGVSVDLDIVDASSIFTVQGKEDMFIELWAKCRTSGGNTN